ncbi:flippase-like domain-containing protein [Fulvivirga ulvae]|uniref:lysylphosphatidylglycerol synthase transmembrane domain-containing protein n=1 Tax=Fulvivirga ulvae TaxID=2904245 RepID=UPI001F3F0771|nr:lysylphosphatidylglycerol synthase transmembrane domain-containing protein [Fulvivirga ulvae]UII35041.1 flippase-like domain-containing protein [Fulvivirga ulvae]
MVKIVVSATAIAIVFSKIDTHDTLALILKANPLWLAGALLAYNLSQGISTTRLKYLLERIGVQDTFGFHIRLYYKGMFYNLILPGGIGGDAYKIVVLKSKFNRRTRRLFEAILLDRLCGLAAILMLTAIIILQIYEADFLTKFGLGISTGFFYPVFYLVVAMGFRKYKRRFLKANLLSLGVQLTQALSVFLLMLSLGIDTNYLHYIGIFFISSIATIIPVTIGGLGMREMVFFYASGYFFFNEANAIALSLLFFIITAASALPGMFIDPDRTTKPAPNVMQLN